jgi:hypothetical protein
MDLSVMISHASMDAAIATAWQRLLRRVFPESKLRYSSDPRDPAFSGYGAFATEILDWIQQSSYILTIQTPNSAFRPWLVWEAGMARALKKAIFVAVYGVKPGQLRNPLDSEPQYEGVNKSDVHRIIRGIAADAKVLYHEEDFESAFVEYDEVMRKYAHLYQSEHIQYEKRIRLELTNDQREALRETGVIPDLATVRSVFGSLDIFGYNETVEEITWVELISRLTEDDAQRLWPGSALAWTNLLGRILRKALKRQLTSANPEGLPLYFWQPNSNGGGISYRPSITKQVRAGGLTSFTISFTQLPPELTARPTGRLGLISHYLDFARMLRWGVLKDTRFKEFFRGGLPEKQMSLKQSEFLDALVNIRIEFQNRGLAKDELITAFPLERREEVETLLQSYYEVVTELEPEKRPSAKQVRELYPRLLSINSTFHKWYLQRSLELLDDEFQDEDD